MTIFGFDRRDVGMLFNMFKLTLTDRFLGSGLGLAWAVLSPLMLMMIFTFVFTFVFPNRLPGREGALPFVIWLLSGYAPWLAFSEGIMTSTTSVVSNGGLVKNVAFKSEILPISGAAVGIVPFLVGLTLIFVLQITLGEFPNTALLIIPLVLAIQILFISGLGLFLSALNVFLRDTALIMPNILLMLLFASPIFYPITSYPEAIQAILQFNPFYVIAACYRAPIIDGTLPPLWMLVYLVVISIALFALGLWWFRRLKAFFSTRL